MMMMAHNEFLSFRSPVQMGLQDVTVEMREFKRAHERWTQQILAAMAIPDFASMAKIDKQKELEALDTFDYWIKTLRSVGQRVPKELL